ncbi:MAG TPA: zinc metalloprotease HtpX [Nitrospiria bacterium]|nr:zinc metalloprotease HtpX [Nitrospiria bacterium]
MPFTFIEIEERKTWRIWLFILVLLLLYLAVLATLTVAVAQTVFIPYHALLNPRFLLLLVATSLTAAVTHFCFSTLGVVDFIRDNLGALEPDPEDGIHKRLLNILREIEVVTGNRRKIEGRVIPTLAMNALAVVNLRGNATIAVTEGLLSRLTRPQLEAVMAHEAYHIISGDCLETTVAASLFGLPSSAFEKFSRTMTASARLSPVLLLVWCLLKLSQIFNMLISREREYRADAGAVRMTRNPLALAEALQLLSRNWRGTGFIGNGFEMLCIVNPVAKALDETEGRWADLMSTHPPIQKRIDILLKMAHAELSEQIVKAASAAGAATAKPSESVFHALDPQHQWQGPFTLPELYALPWISPLTWINDGGPAIERAWKMPQIDPAIFTKRLAEEASPVSRFLCPSCHQPLLEITYERTQIDQCHFCGGALVESDRIPRIIARTENPATDRIQSLSKAAMQESQLRGIGRQMEQSDRKAIPLRNCPKCSHPMMRTFYTLAYPVQIDRCSSCSVTWFDPDELEMLQCMIANKMAAEPLGSTPDAENPEKVLTP